MTLQVYGIPNCGTCKKARQWLDANGVDYEFIDTKMNPPSRDQIRTWVDSLGSKPLRNTSGQAYRAIDAGDRQTWDDDQWIEAFAENAMLIKRPLFVADGTAVMAGFRGSEDSVRASLGL